MALHLTLELFIPWLWRPPARSTPRLHPFPLPSLPPPPPSRPSLQLHTTHRPLHPTHFSLAPPQSLSINTPDEEVVVVEEQDDDEIAETAELEVFFEENRSRFEHDFSSDGQSSSEGEKFRLLFEAGMVDTSSKVLVALGSEAFVDQLCLLSPASVNFAHFSLLTLAMVKEKYDDVRCWHLESTEFPNLPGPFDTVFLHHLPAFSDSPSSLFRAVAALCKPGARVIVSYPLGKCDLAALRKQSSKFLLSDLPDVKDFKIMLSALPLELVNLHDDSDFYLATLKVTG